MGASIVPDMGTWSAVPSSLPLPFPAGLGFCKLSVPPRCPRQRHGGMWWGSLRSQGPIRAVRAERGWGVAEDRGARSELGKRTFRRSLNRGMKGRPQVLDLTHVSPSCRVSHGIAGTLPGEMALCAKKRPPGKTGRSWAGGLLPAYHEWVLRLREQRGEEHLAMTLKEGSLVLLPIRQDPRKPNSFLDP